MNYCSLKAVLKRLPMAPWILGIGLVAVNVQQSCAAESEFKPFLAVSEEVNDNVYQTSSGRQTDYITHVSPGATLHYQSPFWTWDASDTLDYSKYALRREGDQYINNSNVTGKVTLLDNFMYLDVSDTYRRMLLDIAQDVASQSSLFINQTNQNIATVSPYLMWRLGDKSTLKTGYRYTDVRYWGNGIDLFEHTALAEFNHELTSGFSLSAGYDFSRNESFLENYDTHDVYCGFTYKYAEKSSLFGKFGNTWQLFSTSGNVSFPFWDAGIIHDFGTAVATLESSVQTNADPLSVSTKTTSYSGKLDKNFQRGAVGFSSSYTAYEYTQTGVSSQRKLSFSGNGHYEVLDGLTANLAVTADRLYVQNLLTNLYGPIPLGNFRYHFYATSGLSYNLNHDVTVSLNYSYETYRNGLNDAAGSIGINRGIVTVRKNF